MASLFKNVYLIDAKHQSLLESLNFKYKRRIILAQHDPVGPGFVPLRAHDDEATLLEEPCVSLVEPHNHLLLLDIVEPVGDLSCAKDALEQDEAASFLQGLPNPT